METYNGYENWATWNVCLWLGNEEPLYREAQRIARRSEVTPKAAEDFVKELMPNGTPDFNSPKEYKNVNWSEVAEMINDTLN